LSIIAGGVPLFPFIRLFAPFRYYLVSFVFLSLIAYQLSLSISPRTAPIQTDDPRLADVVAYEELLKQKAEQVLQRFGASEYTVDLSVVLDHTTITTTTYEPQECAVPTSELIAEIPTENSTFRDLNEEDHGTWQEEVSTSPRIRSIKICVTLDQDDDIDEDQLFRSLSYTLGIDLKRGDMLRIVVL